MDELKLISNWDKIVNKNIKDKVLKYVRRDNQSALAKSKTSRAVSRKYIRHANCATKGRVHNERSWGELPSMYDTVSENQRFSLTDFSKKKSRKDLYAQELVAGYNEYQLQYYSKHILMSRKPLLKKKQAWRIKS